MRVLLPVVVLAALALAPSAQAKAHRCGEFSASGGTVLRVYAIRGVTCAKAISVAKQDARGTAPAPWRCATATSGTFAGKPVYARCGYGGGGPILKRDHAFVVVQKIAATG